jgi:hypothetical protein
MDGSGFMVSYCDVYVSVVSKFNTTVFSMIDVSMCMVVTV